MKQLTFIYSTHRDIIVTSAHGCSLYFELDLLDEMRNLTHAAAFIMPRRLVDIFTGRV